MIDLKLHNMFWLIPQSSSVTILFIIKSGFVKAMKSIHGNSMSAITPWHWKHWIDKSIGVFSSTLDHVLNSAKRTVINILYIIIWFKVIVLSGTCFANWSLPSFLSRLYLIYCCWETQVVSFFAFWFDSSCKLQKGNEIGFFEMSFSHIYLHVL